MSSEEGLIKYYEDYISFKALVFNKSDLGVYALLVVTMASLLWIFAIFAIYIEAVAVFFCFSFLDADLLRLAGVASGSDGDGNLSEPVRFQMAVGSARF